jgi:hypothetical protein
VPVSAPPADAPEIAVYAVVTATDTVRIHSGGCGMDVRSCEKMLGRAKAVHAKAPRRKGRKENKGVVICPALRLSAFA